MLKQIYAYATAAMITATTFGANDAQATSELEVNGLLRINTQITEDAVKQKLPNLIVNANAGDWKASGAIKVDSLNPKGGIANGKHDARLFWANVSYDGLKESHGTSVTAGILEAYNLSHAPLTKGFMHVTLDDAQKFYGGILAVKLEQSAQLDKNTKITVNGGVGHKPEWLERFGPKSDLILFGGADLEYKKDALTLKGGFEYLDFQDHDTPDGADHFIYGKASIKADDNITLSAYAESLTRKRCGEKGCDTKNIHTLTGSAMFDNIAPRTAWEVAAGSINGDAAAESSIYHTIEGTKTRLTIGAGRNFDTDETAVRLGVLMPF